MTETMTAAVGVIGGSGLYRLLEDDVEELTVATPYGPPSAPVTLGTVGDTRIAFLPRHGSDHSVAPHLIDARANAWALASLGIRAIVSTAAVGSIRAELPPGSLAVPDQLIDLTHGRVGTFFESGDVQHLPFADPFCPELRGLALAAAPEAADGAVVGVIQGPRFSTRAESRMLRTLGVDLLNMTLAPEVALAAELGMGTVNLAVVTDTDAGDAAGDPDGASAELVFRRLAEALPRIREIVLAIATSVPADYAPRELLARAAVEAVLARPVVG